MRVEREQDQHKIHLDEGDNPRDILRALAVASFELSRPAGRGIYHFEGGTTMTPEDADRFIEDRDNRLRLRMDYVEGRQVKTFVDLEEDGSLKIDTWLFERDRGEIEPVLHRAAEILSGGGAASMPVEAVSTRKMYEGKSLELRLNEVGYKRQAEETDLELRRRVFPDLYRRNIILAIEILFGQSSAEWNDENRLRALILLDSKPSDETLAKFATEFTSEK